MSQKYILPLLRVVFVRNAAVNKVGGEGKMGANKKNKK